jgi:hypothetical protein
MQLTIYVSYNMQEARENKEYETRPGNLKQKQAGEAERACNVPDTS